MVMCQGLTGILVLTIMLESNNIIWTQTWKIVFDIIFVYTLLSWIENKK